MSYVYVVTIFRGILSAKFYGVSSYWSCCQSVRRQKSFRLFSVSFYLFQQHTHHGKGSVSQWKRLWTTSFTCCLTKIKWKTLFFACEKTFFFLLYLGSSSRLFSIVNIDEKALKMFVAKIFHQKMFRSHMNHIALWFERGEKKTWVFLWHSVKIRNDLNRFEDSDEIRKKPLNVIPINIFVK